MTVGAGVVRWLAVVCAAALAWSLLLVGGVSAQQPDPLSDACPVDPPQAGFADRAGIPAAHARNVDCAAFLEIVSGFDDNTYRAHLAVRRDQMASFIAQGLDAAGVVLPAGDQDQFGDVTAGPHRVNVNRLALAGIVQGGPGALPASQYGPGLHTRRDQMASFLMRAAGYALSGDPEAFADRFDAPGDQVFTDVPATNTHFGNVNAASVAGLAQGFGGGVFGPQDSTRRDQMASFVVRLLNFLAVPSAVEITEQSAESAVVGETITVTATVFDQYGAPAAETATVRFSADTTPPRSEQVVTEGGRAAFTFTSGVAGMVTVTAEIDGPGGNFAADGDSHSVTKQFTQPGAQPPPPPPTEDEQVFTTSGTFTVPDGVTSITVTAWGAGGAGGQVADARGGGGGGSFCQRTIAVTPSSQYVVTVGAGGTPAEPFGQASLVTGPPSAQTVVHALGGGGGFATGGAGGATDACPIGATAHAGGTGGDPSPAATNRGGGGGGGSATPTAAGGNGQPGAGADGGAGGTGQGTGGRGGDAGQAAVSGQAPGGGGGGKGGGEGASGSGADGRVIISWD